MSWKAGMSSFRRDLTCFSEIVSGLYTHALCWHVQSTMTYYFEVIPKVEDLRLNHKVLKSSNFYFVQQFAVIL